MTHLVTWTAWTNGWKCLCVCVWFFFKGSVLQPLISQTYPTLQPLLPDPASHPSFCRLHSVIAPSTLESVSASVLSGSSSWLLRIKINARRSGFQIVSDQMSHFLGRAENAAHLSQNVSLLSATKLHGPAFPSWGCSFLPSNVSFQGSACSLAPYTWGQTP